MKPPSDDARRLLQQYKEANALGEDAKQRLADLLRERTLRGDLPRFHVNPSDVYAAHGSLAQQLWHAAGGKLAAGLIAVGAVAGAAHQLLQPPAPALQATVAPPRCDPAQGCAKQAHALPEPTQAAEIEVPPVEPVSRRERKPAPPATAVSSEPTIDEEVRLVSQAQAAMRAGHSQQALDILSRHAARFPAGKLTTLRQVTRMLALCQSGRRVQAREEAAAFLAAHPTSPFVERVKGVCPSLD